VAFSLKPDEISQPTEVRGQWVIMKCEGIIDPIEVDRAQADPILEDALKEGKLHTAAQEVFKHLEQEAVVQTIYGDAARQQQHPGVAAIINEHKVTMRLLAEECIERHGIEVLEKILDRKLLEQGLRKRNLTVAKADIDGEISRAALSMGQRKKDGTADIEGWLALVTKQQKLPVEVYVDDAVWPSVAMKKLVGDNINISEDDIKKSYDANYGPRARCRAVVLSNQRKAQEVWEKARDKPTVEHFAALARQYSIDANSGSLGGEVPRSRRTAVSRCWRRKPSAQARRVVERDSGGQFVRRALPGGLHHAHQDRPRRSP